MIDAIKLPPPELYKHVEVYALLSYIIFGWFYDKFFKNVPDSLISLCEKLFSPP